MGATRQARTSLLEYRGLKQQHSTMSCVNLYRRPKDLTDSTRLALHNPFTAAPCVQATSIILDSLLQKTICSSKTFPVGAYDAYKSLNHTSSCYYSMYSSRSNDKGNSVKSPLTFSPSQTGGISKGNPSRKLVWCLNWTARESATDTDAAAEAQKHPMTRVSTAGLYPTSQDLQAGPA